MDILTEAKNILEKVANIRQEYIKLSNILECPEIYADKKYSLHLTASQQRIERIAKMAQDLEDLIALNANENEIGGIMLLLEIELRLYEDDSVTACIIEFSGDENCINLIKQSIDEQIKTHGFTVNKENKWIISGTGVYVCFRDWGGKHIFKGTPKGNALLYVYPEQKIVPFDEKDVKIDYFHSDGAGGQNVNKVETGIRASHIPTGITVTCRDERSQLMNKKRALERLQEQVKDYQEKEINKIIKEIKAKEKEIIAAQYRDGTKI